MPSAFGALWSAVQPIQDGYWGEAVCLVPQNNDDASEYVETGADELRPIREIIGIVTLDAVVDRFLGRGANSRDNTDIMASKTVIDFDEALFPPGAEPQDGDVLILLERPTIPAFKIVSAEFDNAARWVCKVTFDRNELCP